MHGAGDVLLEAVDKESAALLTRLTTEYFTQLCSAAVDAHGILTDGEKNCIPCHTVLRRAQNQTKETGQEHWDDPLPIPMIQSVAS
jgi:hypothetical protein